MKFVIKGALKESARDITIAVEAESREQAKEIANSKGILIASVELSDTVQILSYAIKGVSIKSDDLPPKLYVLGEKEPNGQLFIYPYFDSESTGFVYVWRRLSTLQLWLNHQTRQFSYHEIEKDELIISLLDQPATRYLAYNHIPKRSDPADQLPSERFIKECLLDLHSFRNVWPTIKKIVDSAGVSPATVAAIENLGMAQSKCKTRDVLDRMETVFKLSIKELKSTGDFGILWNCCKDSLKESGIPTRIIDVMKQKVGTRETLTMTKALETIKIKKTTR
jgi:hypothetical protein